MASDSKRRQLEDISFNISMMESSPDDLSDRDKFHQAAVDELRKARLQRRDEEVGDVTGIPADFENALQYAVMHIYRAGNPDFGDDLKRHLEIALEYRRREAMEDEWLPTSQEQINLVHGLIELGSTIGVEDREPAFQPNSGSDRQAEVLDPYDVWYNKWGFLLPGSQQYGSFQGTRE